MVRVPFPFVETNNQRYRPGLAVSPGVIGGRYPLLWVVMITGAGHEPWPDDVEVGPRHLEFGLPIPSRIRVAKITTAEARQAERVGNIDPGILEIVMARLARVLGMHRLEA
ncbi:type II toxin-antitoxin system PemK/MazF family toxin [Aureimonas pseudogalii]|uniref:type II toxin-antitoxin system PemK/MazF family toxin n=1 Tax=Aureimonas pseudogalii TaxID=1744844 RepID=UPI0028AA44F9|nr:type II toxin-antitoxin system PemK/MazF family toxin [Aureimonas pseudogalii]